jgi:hypothetical protein
MPPLRARAGAGHGVEVDTDTGLRALLRLYLAWERPSVARPRGPLIGEHSTACVPAHPVLWRFSRSGARLGEQVDLIYFKLQEPNEASKLTDS